MALGLENGSLAIEREGDRLFGAILQAIGSILRKDVC